MGSHIQIHFNNNNKLEINNNSTYVDQIHGK